MVASGNNKSATNMERGTTLEGEKGGQLKTQNRGGLWCTYCKKSRHTQDKCWKLHGKPPSREWDLKGGRPGSNGQVHVAAGPQGESTSQKPSSLNQEEIKRVRSLINNLEKPEGSPSTCSLAYLGQGFGEDDWTC